MEKHEPFSLEILTPQKPFLVKKVTMAVVPSQDGDCGVLSGMAPLLCALRGGVVCLFDEQLEASERYFVPGGAAWITRERTVLLVPEIVEVARIDVHTTKAEIRKIEEQTNDAKSDKKGEGKVHDAQTAARLETLRQRLESVTNLPYH